MWHFAVALAHGDCTQEFWCGQPSQLVVGALLLVYGVMTMLWA